MTSQKLPPLNAIRAFEAAARHLSFTKAGEELRVTQAAVSHQIKVLEDYLGVTLFERRNNLVVLTDAAQLGLPALREGFERLAAAMEHIRAGARGDILRVTTTPGFAAKWLVPRLQRFRSAHPNIEVRVDASTNLLDLTRGDVDVCIRFGTGQYPGLQSEILFPIEVFPVCSPDLREGPHPLNVPQDLKWHTLLHTNSFLSDGPSPGWRTWLATARADGVDWSRGPQFTEIGVAIQAALEGQGVLLARSELVRDDLAAGRLIRPFELSVRSQYSYFLAYVPTALQSPRVAAFCDWIRSEVH